MRATVARMHAHHCTATCSSVTCSRLPPSALSALVSWPSDFIADEAQLIALRFSAHRLHDAARHDAHALRGRCGRRTAVLLRRHLVVEPRDGVGEAAHGVATERDDKMKRSHKT